MEPTSVYIVTRERQFLLEKALPAWLGLDVDVTLVVERSERESHEEFLAEREWHEVEVISPRKENGGIGYTRQFVLKTAAKLGEEAFIMTDDDLKPMRGDPAEFAQVVLDEEVIGVGAGCSYHGLMIGNEVIRHDEYFPIAGGYGHRLVAINTALAVESGGYPEWNHTWGEDAELQRQGIEMGLPWYLDTRFRFNSLAKRYTEGGLMARFKHPTHRTKKEKECHAQMHRRWPEYVSHPSGRYRCSWKKMMADHIPDWHERMPAKIRRLMSIER